MIQNILLILLYLLAPAGVIFLCRKIPFIGKIGPVLFLYIIGIIIGNVWHPSAMAQIQEVLSSASVPLAIPLLLFGCKFRKDETRNGLLAILSGLISVIIVVVLGFFIFGRGIPEGAKIGGMLTGVYTGGTVNLAAIKIMLGVSEESFILLNSYDMVISFLYLTFLVAIGIRLFRKFLPVSSISSDTNKSVAASVTFCQKIVPSEEKGIKGIKKYFTQMWLPLLSTLVIIGISAVLGLAAKNWFMTVFILSLTTLGIVASLYKPLRDIPHVEPTAMYFIYIFSIVVASMADLSKFDLSSGLNLLAYLTFAVFGSLFLNVLLSKLLRIDADTTIVCSTAFICSPPFVPMMTTAMKNERVLVIGLTAGIIGYAVGNYLGFVVFRILCLL